MLQVQVREKFREYCLCMWGWLGLRHMLSRQNSQLLAVIAFSVKTNNVGESTMQIPRRALNRAAVISPVILLFMLFSLAPAQNRTFNSIHQADIHPSERLVTIKLTTPEGQTATITQYEGEVFKVQRENGEAIGITAQILDSNAVVLYFSKVTRITKKSVVIGEKSSNIGNMEIYDAVPQSTPVGQISTVQLLGISKVVEESKIRISSPQGGCPCCVTCGGVQFCGVVVYASCGSCTCE